MSIYEPFTVLLIEDNADDERLALRALERSGYPMLVRVVRDGREALHALGIEGDQKISADLVISDLKLPMVNGDEIVGRVRSSGDLQTPYVVFSSSDSDSDAEKCLSSGASEYVTKPMEFEPFLQCVKELVGRYLHPRRVERNRFCVLDAEAYELAA